MASYLDHYSGITTIKMFVDNASYNDTYKKMTLSTYDLMYNDA